MMGFWIAGALATVLVLALLFRPFLLKSGGNGISRRQLNAAIYRDQLARLERDRVDNMLAEADYAQARDELERRVIEDTREEDATATARAPRKTMLAVGLALPAVAIGLYVLLGNPAAFLEPSGPQRQVSAQDMERLVAGLAQKLEKDPSNLQGWAMLARSYKMMGRNTEAERAFERAGSFLDNDAQLLAIYADLAATNANGNFAGKPTLLIQKALKVDPENPMALWLAGTAAFRGQQYDAAIRTWERLMQQLAPDSEDANMLQESIGAAYAALGKSAPKTTPGSKPVVAATGASVSGKVDLAPALKNKAAPGDIVMVIARAPGSRMPVAVVRARVSDLPLSFTLDDSLAMSPQARISQASQVDVEARISKSGMAQPEPGDLMSSAQTVKVGATGIALQVNAVRP